MEPQLVEMIRDRFDAQDRVLEDIQSSIATHVTKDEAYWKRLDVQEGQMTLLKAIGGSSALAAIGAWLWNKFH